MLAVNCLIFSTNIKFANVSIFLWIASSSIPFSVHSSHITMPINNSMSHTIVNTTACSAHTQKKMREGKRTKSAIGILQLPFCLRLFYINWPSSTHQKRASRLNKNWTREVKRDVWMRMWKVQCEKMTAINHSCWASFKYKSISIFHFYALEPSKHPICSSLPYPYGTLSKRRGYHHADSRHIAYWSAYRICHFLTAISRMQSLSQLARKNNNARVCWSSIKNVHTRCKLIFSLFCYHAVIIPAVVLWFFFTCSQLGKFVEIFVKKKALQIFLIG